MIEKTSVIDKQTDLGVLPVRIKNTNTDGFSEKFSIDDDSGAFVMRADAMPRRFDRNEVKPLERNHDDITRGSLGNREWSQEQRLISEAYRLLGMGIARPTTQSLEEWVMEHSGGDSNGYN